MIPKLFAGLTMASAEREKKSASRASTSSYSSKHLLHAETRADVLSMRTMELGSGLSDMSRRSAESPQETTLENPGRFTIASCPYVRKLVRTYGHGSTVTPGTLGHGQKKLSKKALRSVGVRSAVAVIPRKKAKKKASKKRRPAKKLTTRRGAQHIARRAARLEAKNRKRAMALIADITQRKKRIARDFYAIGEALKLLSDPALYHAAGYARFDHLIKGERLMGKTLAYKLIAIVDTYPANTARKLGIEKAYALFAYTEATPAEDLAPQLAESNPRIGETRLERMSVRDLLDAARRARAANAGRAATEAERDARRVAKRVQKKLRAKGAKSAKARAKSHRGEWRIRLDLAVDEVSALE